MAASARALPFSSLRDLSTDSLSICRPLLSSRGRLLFTRRARGPRRPVLSCLGGVADDFVSTRRSGALGRREFQALANMLRRVEPLDTSMIGQGVSGAAKDAMKRTISAMLGLLPSNQFDVLVQVSRRPLHHLLVSSIITGYTLWNAEYRVSLMRNFESSPERKEVAAASSGCEAVGEESKERKERDEMRRGGVGGQRMRGLGIISGLSPAALSCIRELELELATAEKELDAQKQDYMHLEHKKEDNNDLLKYLRSLEPAMVFELSRSSSSEVDEIIQRLVQNIHMKLFSDDNFSDREKTASQPKASDDQCDAVDTTRDYLAKLLFWYVIFLTSEILFCLLTVAVACYSHANNVNLSLGMRIDSQAGETTAGLLLVVVYV